MIQKKPFSLEGADALNLFEPVHLTVSDVYMTQTITKTPILL